VNAAQIEYVQQAAGYSLTGDTSEQCLFLQDGTGANGKGTFLDTLAETLGA
jgi:putative DNA primase/helicase